MFSLINRESMMMVTNGVNRLVTDVASKTNEVAGDGTTTATVLARAIFAEGVKNVAAGCNPMDLRRGVQAAVDAVVDFLKANSRVITTSSEIAQVLSYTMDGWLKERITDGNGIIGSNHLSEW